LYRTCWSNDTACRPRAQRTCLATFGLHEWYCYKYTWLWSEIQVFSPLSPSRHQYLDKHIFAMNHCRHHHLLTAPTITQRRAAPEELIATPPRNTARLSPTIPPDCSASPADASDGADRARLGAYEKAAKCSKEMTSQKEPFDLEPVVTVRDRTNLPAKQMSIHDVEEERRRLKELSEHSTPTNLSQSPQQANPTVHLYPPTTATAPRAG